MTYHPQSWAGIFAAVDRATRADAAIQPHPEPSGLDDPRHVHDTAAALLAEMEEAR